MHLRLLMLLAVTILPTQASIIFSPGGSGTGSNVLFKCPADDAFCLADLSDNDNTLIGTVQNDPYQVLFSADVDIMPSGAGQATITRVAADADWKSLSFDWLNFTATTELILRVKPAVATTVTLYATDQFGNTFSKGFADVNAPSGSFFTISTDDDQLITAVRLESGGSLSHVEQVRLGEIHTAVIPEPATTALLGAGLLAFGLLARSRRSGSS